MKRKDMFILGMTSFLLANCISYFVRSGAPYLTGWGLSPGRLEIQEGIGVPFEMYSFGLGIVSCSAVNSLLNVVVAIAVSSLLAICVVPRLPPLWLRQARTFRLSMRVLLSITTIVCILLCIAIKSRPWGLVVRNSVCLVGPGLLYAWFLYRRKISWVHLTVAAVGLTIMALAVDYQYQEPQIHAQDIGRAILPVVTGADDSRDTSQRVYAEAIVGLTLIRTGVPVFGLFSLLVVGHAVLKLQRGQSRRFAESKGQTSTVD